MRVRYGIAALAIACSTSAWSQTADQSAASFFAKCNVRQVIMKETRDKVAAQASGSCDTGGGGVKSCQAAVSATQGGYVLDSSDTRNACYKLPDGGDNPCAFVQYGPVIFQSDTTASQIFTTNSGRVTVQLNVGQFAVIQTVDSDTIVQSNLVLVPGRQFTVKRTNAANSTVSLECQKSNGDQFINLVPGNDNSGGKIKQVGVENAGAFDLYTMQVVP
jgi:hypothetical protein